MSRMKRLLSVWSAICLLLCGWPAVNSAFAEASGTDDAPALSAIPVLREMIEEDKRANEEMEKMGYHALPVGLYAVLTESSEPYAPIDTGSVSVSGDSVDLTLAARIEGDESIGIVDYSVTVLLTVNGCMVDYEMDGGRSSGGLLVKTLRGSRDYLLPVHADHLPAAEGENEIMLVLLPFCPEKEMYLDMQFFTCSFRSDHASEGAVIEPCPEERIDRVVTVQNRKDAPELMSMPIVDAGEQLAFESDHRGHNLLRTKPSPTMHFYIDNMSISDMIGRRAGLMALSIDGELQPVWDGKLIGEIRLQEEDLLKAVLLKTDFGSGEHHNVCWYYIETESAGEWKAWNRSCITVETR